MAPQRLSRGAGEPLSQREIEVLQAVADWGGIRSAAKILYVSPSTVRNHLRNIAYKFEIKSGKLEVVVEGFRRGLLH